MNYSGTMSTVILKPEILNVCCASDNNAPIALCQDITIDIQNASTVMIDYMDVDDGSYDDCGIDSYSLSQDIFSCNDVGMLSINLTVTDINGNVSSCTSQVEVLDIYGNCCPNVLDIDSDPIDPGTYKANNLNNIRYTK